MSTSGPQTKTAKSPSATGSQLMFDYHRTIIAYHGTTRSTAAALVSGATFDQSTNRDDWLGHGIYFWEYAPQQAWWWAQRRYGQEQSAVVGAIIRLGLCLDLLDPANASLLNAARTELLRALKRNRLPVPVNHNRHKYLDCAVFNFLYARVQRQGYNVDSCRAVFVPLQGGQMPRAWSTSGVLQGAHIQVCVRQPANILAVWAVRKDGRYGKDD